MGCLAVGTLALSARPACAQSANFSGYDDYGTFSTDPVDLDEEYSQTFGRFFLNSFLIGTGLETRDLGGAYSAGVDLGLRFIFFFDKIWASELGIGYSRHYGLYEQANTNTANVFLQMSQNLIPISFGVRYGFDREALPRGFAAMNPYLALNGEVVFRQEAVGNNANTTGLTPDQQTKYAAGNTNSDTAFGVALGGGFEFDVYRKKLFIGLDFRYHLMFWPDRNETIGQLGRSGDYLSLLGAITYSY